MSKYTVEKKISPLVYSLDRQAKVGQRVQIILPDGETIGCILDKEGEFSINLKVDVSYRDE